MERTKATSLDYALEIFSSDAYLTVNKKLLQHYGPDTAVFLSNLIDKYKYFLNTSIEEDEWFYLVHDQQIEQTGLTLTKIRTCKQVLKEDGILFTERRGIPAKEFYKLDLSRLLSLIDPKISGVRTRPKESLGQDLASLGGQDLASLGGLIIINKTKYKDTKEDISGPKSISERNIEYLPLSKKLSEIISATKNIKHTPVQIKNWSNEIRRLVENNKVPISRIEVVLDWYSKNVGREYVPVVESGTSFREKFTRLEDAIKRDGIRVKRKEEDVEVNMPDWVKKLHP